MATLNKEKKPITPKKVIGLIFSYIFILVFVLVFAAFIYIFAQVSTGRAPSLLGYRLYYVLTDSMSPTIEPKQIIVSKIINDSSKVDEMVDVGDVITFSATLSDGTAIFNTHRVVKDVYYDEALDGYYLQTKGDNPYVGVDNPIPTSAVQAVMIEKVPAVSSIFNSVTSQTGLIFFLGIPLIFIFSVLIIKLVTIIKTPVKNDEIPSQDDIEQKKALIAKNAIEEYIKNHQNDGNNTK